METYIQFFHPHILPHSDPTYEAWKLGDMGEDGKATSSYSDPTYEAWKLHNLNKKALPY